MSPQLSHVANVIFDMATEEEEHDAVFHFLRSGQYPLLASARMKREPLDAKLKTITKWRRMPCFIALEMVVVGTSFMEGEGNNY